MTTAAAPMRRYALVLLIGSMAMVLLAWILWAAGVIDSDGQSDPNGNPIGIDYAIFHTAGRVMTDGDGANLYTEAVFLDELAATTGEPDQDASRLFVNPPFFSALFMPVADMPYRTALAIWSFLGLAALAASVWLVGARGLVKVVAASLLFYPVFVAFRLGQNSFLSLLLLSACFAMLAKGNYRLAGVALGLLVFKPQLALGTALWWSIDWRHYREAWLSAIATAGSVAGLGWLLWPATTKAYVESFTDLVGFQNPEFLRSTFSPYGFFALLLPDQDTAVYVLTLLAAVAGLAWFWSYWKDHRTDLTGLFALSILLTLWLSPRVVLYDWTLLLLPGIIFATRRAELKDAWLGLGGLLAFAATFSLQFTETQLDSGTRAVQLAVPILALVAVLATRSLTAKPLD